VYELTPQGLRAVSKGTVRYFVDGLTRDAMTDISSNGRYTIPAVPAGTRIRLTAYSIELEQTCAIDTVFAGGDTLPDIKLVRLGTHDVTCGGATLSGVVFRIVDGERRPLKQQRVGFYGGGRIVFDVYATTKC
jgi:hypothetical protein